MAIASKERTMIGFDPQATRDRGTLIRSYPEAQKDYSRFGMKDFLEAIGGEKSSPRERQQAYMAFFNSSLSDQPIPRSMISEHVITWIIHGTHGSREMEEADSVLSMISSIKRAEEPGKDPQDYEDYKLIVQGEIYHRLQSKGLLVVDDAKTRADRNSKFLSKWRERFFPDINSPLSNHQSL